MPLRPPTAPRLAPRLLAASLLLGATAGCGGAEAPRRAAARPTPPAALPPDPGPLLALLPLEHTRGLLLSLRPARWAREPAVARVVFALLDGERLRRWGRRHGFDPLDLEHVVGVRGEQGWLALLRGPLDAPFEVEALGARMTGLRVEQRRPWPRRWGWLGDTLLDVTALSARVGMVATDAALAERVRGGLAHIEEAHPLPEALRQPLREASAGLGWVGPLPIAREGEAAALLAGVQALSATLWPVADGSERLQLRVVLLGRFPPQAEEPFRRLAASVLDSDLGHLLGLAEALPSLRVVAGRRVVLLSLRLEAARLARGLRTLLVAEMPELLDWPAPGGARGGGEGRPEPAPR